jgi:mannose-6-phosphate isomerase-like protein (cupin superfamily)
VNSMHVFKKTSLTLSSELNVLIKKETTGAENCQAGIAKIPVNRSLPESGYSKHPTEEVCYVVRGKVRVQTQNSSWELEGGDIAFIPKNEEHRNINIGEKEAVIFWVTAPPTL